MASRECSVADALEVVGQRWSLLVVRELRLGVHRFDQIVRNTSAPRDVLTSRLRHLEAVGILYRQQYNEHPPRFEYHLTPKGKELGDVLLLLMAWGDKHLNPDDPPLRLTHGCGNELDPVVVCGTCGKPALADIKGATGRGALAPG